MTFNRRSDLKAKKEKEKESREESTDHTESGFAFDTFAGTDTAFTTSIKKFKDYETVQAATTCDSRL